MKLIDKDALVAEIEKRIKEREEEEKKGWAYSRVKIVECEHILSFIDTLKVKEVDLDALGVLAEHLIACDAHLVTPKYTDKELDLLEEWAKNNKAQKGEEV
jgi:hypothetical protein